MVVVYTIGSLIRVEITNAASKIMFEDLPQVDRILEMCRVRIRALWPLFFTKLCFAHAPARLNRTL